MDNEVEIKALYKEQHDILTSDYYSGVSGLTKGQFDLEHGQIWEDLGVELILRGYKITPEPQRDLAKEIDILRERVKILEPRSS